MSKGWEHKALCKGMNQEVFFGANPMVMTRAEITNARSICAGCSVSRDCLIASFSQQETYGVWSGLTSTERMTYLREHPTWEKALEKALLDKEEKENAHAKK